MPHFPATIYTTVFDQRELPPAPAPRKPVASRSAGEGFFSRLTRVFGRRPSVLRLSSDREDLFEYHNPTLGVREFGASPRA